MAWISLNDALQTVAITKGGTGLTTQPQLATNLASTSTAGIFQASPRPGVVGTLPVANGGTGSTTAAGALTNLGIIYSTAQTTTGTNSSDNSPSISVDWEILKITSLELAFCFGDYYVASKAITKFKTYGQYGGSSNTGADIGIYYNTGTVNFPVIYKQPPFCITDTGNGSNVLVTDVSNIVSDAVAIRFIYNGTKNFIGSNSVLHGKIFTFGKLADE